MDGSEINAVVRLHHDALAAWLAHGDRRQLERFLAGHDDEFTLITVDGAKFDVATLRAGLARAGASQPTLQLHVDDVCVLAMSGDVAVVRFLETHRRTNDPEQGEQRWTTAALRRHAEEWRWLTVHETAVND